MNNYEWYLNYFLWYTISVPICITLKNKACAFLNSNNATARLQSQNEFPWGDHTHTTLRLACFPFQPTFHFFPLQLLIYSAVDTGNITLATSPLWFGWYRAVTINGILTGSLGSWQTPSWDFFPWPQFGGFLSWNSSVSFLSTFKKVSVEHLKKYKKDINIHI